MLCGFLPCEKKMRRPFVFSSFLLFHADDLIHSVVRYLHGDGKVFCKYLLKLVLMHEADGDLARMTGVVAVDLFAAHAVRHGERTAGAEHSRKRTYQPLRLRKVREGVIHHYSVKAAAKLRRLHVAADYLHILLWEFRGGYLRHLRGDINAHDVLHVSRDIIGYQHAGAAGDVYKDAVIDTN